MVRDRVRSQARLVAAVGQVLTEVGFKGLGVNAVARRADLDKVLIYRYFGGFDALLEAYARSGDLWWSVDEIVGEHLPGPERDSLAAWCVLALTRQVAALRQRPVTQQILAWELVEPNPLSRALSELREARTRQLVGRLVERGGGRAHGLLPTLHGLLGAASLYLVLRAHSVGQWHGVDFTTEAGWGRLDGAIAALVHAALGEPQATPSRR